MSKIDGDRLIKLIILEYLDNDHTRQNYRHTHIQTQIDIVINNNIQRLKESYIFR